MTKFAVTEDARNVEEEVVAERQKDQVQKIVARERFSDQEKHAGKKQKERLVNFKIKNNTIHLDLFVKCFYFRINHEWLCFINP